MLKKSNDQPIKPKRVVVLGAKGFVGSNTVKRLVKEGMSILALGREELDLCDTQAANQLAGILHADDVLIVIAAQAPCKNHTMLVKNILMMQSVCDALAQRAVRQVVYISSDAVYADSMGKLSEASPAAPTSIHGVMHLAREKMLESVVPESLTILRPSLLYGAGDPHNGYGPNSFYRLVAAGEPIKLFGNGEEQRDHVYIKDVTEMVCLCLLYQCYGIMNITTGEVISFYDAAQQVNRLFDNPVQINCQPRKGAMPHNGYRAFDNGNCQQVFPEFHYTSFVEGILKMHDTCQQQQEEISDARN